MNGTLKTPVSAIEAQKLGHIQKSIPKVAETTPPKKSELNMYRKNSKSPPKKKVKSHPR